MSIEFPDDVERIRRVLAQRRVCVSDQQIEDAWQRYSDSVMAGWVALPESDQELSRMILPFLY
jgi:hypothetical protein